MARRRWWLLVVALSMLFAASVVAVVSSSRASFAQTPPAGDVPSAPTDAQFLGGVLMWSDNADNEDGYRITVSVRSDLTGEVTEFQYEVAANITTFPLPEEVRFGCPDRTSISFEVVALNEAGESDPARFSIDLLCPQPTATAPTAPTATAGPGLPSTGTGRSNSSDFTWLIATLALAGLALASGGALAAKRR